MITIIIGKQGQGKTTLTKKLIDDSLNNILIFDVTGEYQFLKKKSFKVFNFYKELKTELLKNESKKIIFNLRKPGHIDYIIPLLLKIKNIDLYFDESHLINKRESMSILLRYSRQLNINIFLISHRIYDLPVIFRALLNQLIIFNIQSIEDLEYLRKFLNPDIAGEIKQLKQFEYFIFYLKEGIKTKNHLTTNFKKNNMRKSGKY